jgi:hypothetical protein
MTCRYGYAKSVVRGPAARCQARHLTNPVLALPEVRGHAISIRAKAPAFEDPLSRLVLDRGRPCSTPPAGSPVSAGSGRT